jgi:hypothetical protein
MYHLAQNKRLAFTVAVDDPGRSSAITRHRCLSRFRAAPLSVGDFDYTGSISKCGDRPTSLLIQARNRVITFGRTPNAHSYQQLEAIRFLPTRPAAGVARNDR